MKRLILGRDDCATEIAHMCADPRIVVVGTSGAGKTELAHTLIRTLQLGDLDLDALFWKPGWTPRSFDELAARIDAFLAVSPRFAAHGNYNSVQARVWGASSCVIWLDYSRSVVMWRVLKRTLVRILTRKKLYADNVETFRKSFFSRDSIILWSWNTFRRRRLEYGRLLRRGAYDVESFFVLTKPRHARLFVNQLRRVLRLSA